MLEAINEFKKGMIKDLNPLTVPNDVLTDALNATLITYNGNEFVLQQDMGNGRVESAYLPSGYVPIGVKEFGGIIYIASYNPLTNKCLVGSFPSPERNISSLELNTLNKVLDVNSFGFTTTEGVTSFITTILLFDNNILRPGDKFAVLVLSSDNTETSEQFNTRISSLLTGYLTSSSLKTNLLTLKLAIVSADGYLIDITDKLKRFFSKDYPNVFSKKSDSKTYTSIGTKALGDQLEDRTEYSTTKSGVPDILGFFALVLDELDTTNTVINGRKLENYYNIYNNKIAGSLCVIAELPSITSSSISVYGIKSKDDSTTPVSTKTIVTLNSNFKFLSANTPEYFDGAEVEFTYLPNNKTDSDRIFAKTEYTESGLLYFTLSNTYTDKIIFTGGSIENSIYLPEYRVKFGHQINTTIYKKDYTNLVSGTISYTIRPLMKFGKLSNFNKSGQIKLDKIGSGESKLSTWKFYTDLIGLTTNLDFLLEVYPADGETLGDTTFSFYDFKDYVKNKETYLFSTPSYVYIIPAAMLLNQFLTILLQLGADNTSTTLAKNSIFIVRISTSVTTIGVSTSSKTEYSFDRMMMTSEMFNYEYVNGKLEIARYNPKDLESVDESLALIEFDWLPLKLIEFKLQDTLSTKVPTYIETSLLEPTSPTLSNAWDSNYTIATAKSKEVVTWNYVKNIVVKDADILMIHGIAELPKITWELESRLTKGETVLDKKNTVTSKITNSTIESTITKNTVFNIEFDRPITFRGKIFSPHFGNSRNINKILGYTSDRLSPDKIATISVVSTKSQFNWVSVFYYSSSQIGTVSVLDDSDTSTSNYRKMDKLKIHSTYNACSIDFPRLSKVDKNGKIGKSVNISSAISLFKFDEEPNIIPLHQIVDYSADYGDWSNANLRAGSDRNKKHFLRKYYMFLWKNRGFTVDSPRNLFLIDLYLVPSEPNDFKTLYSAFFQDKLGYIYTARPYTAEDSNKFWGGSIIKWSGEYELLSTLTLSGKINNTREVKLQLGTTLFVTSDLVTWVELYKEIKSKNLNDFKLLTISINPIIDSEDAKYSTKAKSYESFRSTVEATVHTESIMTDDSGTIRSRQPSHFNENSVYYYNTEITPSTQGDSNTHITFLKNLEFDYANLWLNYKGKTPEFTYPSSSDDRSLKLYDNHPGEYDNVLDFSTCGNTITESIIDFDSRYIYNKLSEYPTGIFPVRQY